jgi:hypothetical protein
MNEKEVSRPAVMAIDPWRRGFGFAYFEGEQSLIDWGLCQVPLNNRNEKSLIRLKAMLDRHHPDYLILEPWDAPDCRRCKRVRKFLAAAAKVALSRGIEVRYLSHRDVIISFSQSAVEPSKQVIAKTLALIYPELAFRLPPRRMPWMGEDPRMSIYDAAALAVAYYRSYESAEAPTAVQSNSLNYFHHA